MHVTEVYIRDDTPAAELLQRIRQAVIALLPADVRVRKWGPHSGGERMGATNMIRFSVRYEPEPAG